MSDPLAQFRKKVPVAAAPAAATGKPSEYAAFGAKDRVTRLQLRRVLNPWRSPAYSNLLDISYDGEHGLNFVLVYGFMFVLVRGKNLQAVVHAIQEGTAEFIQQFDADQWQEPAPGAPLIESIEIAQPGQANVGDPGEGGKAIH